MQVVGDGLMEKKRISSVGVGIKEWMKEMKKKKENVCIKLNQSEVWTEVKFSKLPHQLPLSLFNSCLSVYYFMFFFVWKNPIFCLLVRIKKPPPKVSKRWRFVGWLLRLSSFFLLFSLFCLQLPESETKLNLSALNIYIEWNMYSCLFHCLFVPQ